MNLSELGVVLSHLDLDIRGKAPNSSGYIQVSCPLAKWLHESGEDKNPGCSISVDTVPTTFRCFACGERGKLSDLIDSVASLSKNEELKKLALELAVSDKPSLRTKLQSASTSISDWVKPPKNAKPSPISPELLSRFHPAWEHPSSRSYLIGRTISQRVTELFDLRYDDRQRRVIFPVKDVSGDLYGLVGRAIDVDNEKRYRNYLGFSSGHSLGGIHQLRHFPKTLVCEGYFDLINPVEWAWTKGYDIVCTWHADISEFQAEQLQSLDSTLYFCYDNDTAGHRGWSRARELLGRVTTLRRIIPPVDLDLGLMTETQFTSFLERKLI